MFSCVSKGAPLWNRVFIGLSIPFIPVCAGEFEPGAWWQPWGIYTSVPTLKAFLLSLRLRERLLQSRLLNPKRRWSSPEAFPKGSEDSA